MTLRKGYSPSSRIYAVLGLPMYLLVVVVIASTAIVLFGLSLLTVYGNTQIHQVERQIDMILTESSNMFEYADVGSLVHLQVEFPSSLRFMVFGSLPRNGTEEPVNLTLDENTSNNYYFVMDDGTLHTFHSNARFSNHNCTQIVILHPGRYTLTLELSSLGGKTYVTLL